MSIWAGSGTKQYQTNQAWFDAKPHLCHMFCGGHKQLPQRCCCSETTGREWGPEGPSAPLPLLPPAVTPPFSPAAAQRDFVVQVTKLVYYGLWAPCRKDRRHLQKQLKSMRSSVKCSASETPNSYTDPHCTHTSTHTVFSARSSGSTILKEMLIPPRSATLVSYPNCS